MNGEMLSVVLIFILLTGCQSLEVVNRYQYVEAGIESLPGSEQIEGILIMNHYHPEMADIIMLVGNQDNVEGIIGREINPEKVVSDCVWIKRIHEDYLEARRTNTFGRGSFNDSRVVFVTKERAYMIEFGVDEEKGRYTVVYGDDYESEQLRKDLEELGLFD